jgi:hypothetical protein
LFSGFAAYYITIGKLKIWKQKVIKVREYTSCDVIAGRPGREWRISHGYETECCEKLDRIHNDILFKEI